MGNQACCKELSKMKEALVDKLYDAFVSDTTLSAIDTDEAGAIFDMIKDIAAAERYQAQACYYSTVTKSMDEESDSYIMGYIPEDDDWYSKRRMTKSRDAWNRRKYGRNELDHEYDEDLRSEHSQYFDDYKADKKYYTESHDASYKIKMDEDADKHLADSVDTIKEIWEDADPTLRNKMKVELVALVNSLTA